jgi:hypothetical protein
MPQAIALTGVLMSNLFGLTEVQLEQLRPLMTGAF